MAKIPGTRKGIPIKMPPINVPDDIVYDPENPIILFSCSRSPDLHTEDCDSNCERVILEEIDIDAINEERAWARAGMNTEAYSSNQFNSDAKLHALFTILENMVGMDKDEMELIYKRSRLKMMKDLREDFEPKLTQARLRSTLIDPATGRPMQ